MPGTDVVKDEKGDLVTDCHSILTGRTHFSKLLTVYGVNDVRQIEIHTAEPLVPNPSTFVDVIATERLTYLLTYSMEQSPS